MKILCICKQGIVRSGALAWLLKTEFGHDAVSVGWETNGPPVRDLLGTWADRILCVDADSIASVHEMHRDKITDFPLGEDRWHDPANAELHSILRTMIKERLNA